MIKKTKVEEDFRKTYGRYPSVLEKKQYEPHFRSKHLRMWVGEKNLSMVKYPGWSGYNKKVI